MYNDCTICWTTRKQDTVADSSTYAEYIALYEATKEALWLKALAKSVNVDITEPIRIFEDNAGCKAIAESYTCHKKTKHWDIKYHANRQQVEKKNDSNRKNKY